jgi:N utilization substance protein B
MLVIYMKNRSELREVIMKVIYQVNIFEETNLDYNINDLIHEQMEIENDFVNTCVNGIIEHKKDIYKVANKFLNDWTMDRLNKVDQAIISLGIYELLYTETPSIVSINEAIELSKKYSDEAVTKMINGVLDKVYHDIEK